MKPETQSPAKSAFTPGKWSVQNASGEYRIMSGQQQIGSTYLRGQEDKANADLMSAAPAMFEALRLVSQQIDLGAYVIQFDHMGNKRLGEIVSAALNQAEGK